MKLSVVIPARDEEGSIEQTAAEVATALTGERIPFEIVVVDDGSTDQTTACVRRSMERHPGVRLVSNRSEEHTSELQSPCNLVCRPALVKKKKTTTTATGLSCGSLSARERSLADGG